MAKTISFSIFKGGTGKTTTAVNTAAALAALGKRVLLADLDQQASSTKYLGIDSEQVSPNFYHIFQKQVPASMARRKTAWGFDIIPSSSLMAAIEEALEPGEEVMLRDILKPLQDEYDYMLLDSPPGKAMLAFNAILAANWLIVPAAAERMAIDGVSDLIKHVQEVFWHKYREELSDQQIRILFTMYKANTSHSPGIVQTVKRIYRDNVLDILVPEAIEFPRSVDKKMPITALSPKHPGAKAYQELALWIVNNVK